LNLAACGGTFLTGPPWRDFLGINCLRCKVPQTDAIDQNPVKSGLGQGLTRLTRFFNIRNIPGPDLAYKD